MKLHIMSQAILLVVNQQNGKTLKRQLNLFNLCEISQPHNSEKKNKSGT